MNLGELYIFNRDNEGVYQKEEKMHFNGSIKLFESLIFSNICLYEYDEVYKDYCKLEFWKHIFNSSCFCSSSFFSIYFFI